MTLDFPAVGDRVADWLYSRRMSIRAVHPEMPFGTRGIAALADALRKDV